MLWLCERDVWKYMYYMFGEMLFTQLTTLTELCIIYSRINQLNVDGQTAKITPAFSLMTLEER